MFTIAFYAIAAAALLASLIADRTKTRRALAKAWKAFLGILPEFIVVIVITGVILSFLNAETISRVIGEESGWAGVFGAAVVGSVTLMPGFVAFPLAAVILEQGGGLVQIAAFVSTLMMVGVITFPVERRVFGTRIALAVLAGLWLIAPDRAENAVHTIGLSLREMLLVIPPAFALTRLAANVPAILLMSFVLSRVVRQDELAAPSPAD
ncbi:MAG: permease [Spirochaetota bacterium]